MGLNNFFRKHKLALLVIIGLTSLVMHFNHFNKNVMSAHVWRQAQTQANIVNFYEEDMNILNPRRDDRGAGDGIFRMEFPLMQFMVALGYKTFGNHIIVTRICMFLLSLLTILGMYFFLNVLFKNTMLAILGAWAFSLSPTFYYHSFNPMPDNMALCCGIWSLAFFFQWRENKRSITLLISGLLLCVSTLTKLPFVLYGGAAATWFLLEAFRGRINRKLLSQVLTFSCWMILPMAWYIYVIPGWKGNGVVKGVLDNADSLSTALDNIQHHLISSLPEVLINYASVPFFIAGIVYFVRYKKYKSPQFWLPAFPSLLVLAYFLFESNMIGKSHDYYLYPFYPFIFVIVAAGIHYLLTGFNPTVKIISFFLLLLAPLTCYLRMQGRWDPNSPGFNKELLSDTEQLKKAVPDDALVVAGNDYSHFIFLYYIHKKGWSFEGDHLSNNSLEKMISEGAEYLYTDSEIVKSDSNLQAHFDKKVLELNSIDVYKLK